MDDRLIEHGINAGLSYAFAGRRLHGSAVSPAVRHIGNKMAKIGAAGRVAYAAYKYGKRKLSGSFSQNEKTKMPATPKNRSRRGSDVSMKSVKKILDFGRSPAKRSPAYMKKVGKRLVRKSLRASGASSSKSAGRFGKGNRKLQVLDYYSKRGIVVARETGGIVASGATEKAQSALVGHSTFCNLQLRTDIARAFVKMIFNKMRVAIFNFTDIVNTGRNLQIVVYYLLYPGHTGSSINLVVTNTTTYDDIVTWFSDTVLALADASPEVYFTDLFVREEFVATTPGVGGTILLNLNLASCSFNIYNKSSLKIQNRTISAAGNIEGDDVDNVPLFGKSYSGSGNWAQFGSSMSSATLIVTQDSVTNAPVVTKKFGGTIANTANLAEPPVKSQVRHCTAVGKAHLDPGQVKTDVLVYKKTFSLNGLVRKYMRSTALLLDTSRIAIGKYRFFMLEKMIQAVQTTDVNSITIAYELDHKTGIVCQCKRSLQTNYIVTQTPL